MKLLRIKFTLAAKTIIQNKFSARGNNTSKAMILRKRKFHEFYLHQVFIQHLYIYHLTFKYLIKLF